MATYNGTLWVPTESDVMYGYLPYSDIPYPAFSSGWNFSTDQKHGGSYSLRLIPGGSYSINYGCDAGSKTITIYAYAPAYGTLLIEVRDPDTGELMGSDATTSTEVWEQLTVTFTAEKKVYVVNLIHAGCSEFHGGEHLGYFDDLV